MFEVVSETRIGAPRALVWDLVADFHAHHRWRDKLVSMTHLSGPERGVDARYREVISVGPLRARSQMRVIEHEPPSHLTFEVEPPSRFLSVNRIRLEGDDEVRVEFVSANAPSGVIAALDALWVVLFRRSLDRELANLKALAEAIR